ncbi:MAG: hypothetical protein K9N35_03695 [Candidatus Marinimicrobia bacterium]|nr:hypothetical protein [Candidatus Neomarinimicrobiota bacterium]
MKYLQFTALSFILVLSACQSTAPDPLPKKIVGQLKVGFDVDDTILFSRENFILAPHLSDDPDHVDYGWINTHDSLYSVTIQPIAELIGFLRSQGHEVYFITARPGVNGDAVARHLSHELGFPVTVGDNLFFSTKEKDPLTGNKYTTKHRTISQLGLHIFFGDADNDMVAAAVAGVRGVRVVRDPRSIEAYSKNYFGDLLSEHTDSSPYSMETYQKFLSMGVGPYGETIYPIYLNPDSTRALSE